MLELVKTGFVFGKLGVQNTPCTPDWLIPKMIKQKNALECSSVNLLDKFQKISLTPSEIQEGMDDDRQTKHHKLKEPLSQ
jgi:hypothetical protein